MATPLPTNPILLRVLLVRSGASATQSRPLTPFAFVSLHLPLRLASLVLALLVAGLHPTPAVDAATPADLGERLFIMDNNLQQLDPIEGAGVLQTHGVHAFGASRRNVLAYLPALHAAGIRLATVYYVLEIAPSGSAVDSEFRAQLDALSGSGATLWIAIRRVYIPGEPAGISDPRGDLVARGALQELLGETRPRGLTLALYPHAGFWLARVDDAVRLARAFPDASVGVTFNLCHWLKVEGHVDPLPTLRAAAPWLRLVTINGADAGDTRTFDWNRLIQRLDQGSYDLGALLRSIASAGFSGAIGLQGYNVSGDPRINLPRNLTAWESLSRSARAGPPSTPP